MTFPKKSIKEQTFLTEGKKKRKKKEEEERK